ncbi:hypothetical protein AB2M62_00680 [Sphingomonas sp. MMS12-HWE2-04]|uniref:hypothetical protein n=1 Tax=Sphingomonas sp. MMS12-HWE2-04 TaxID=3234199 RepID=UPI00384F8201
MTGALPRVASADGAQPARAALDRSACGAIEIPRPPLDALPYRAFVAALLGRQGFRLDFNRLAPDAALAMVSDQLFGPGAYLRDRAALAEDIAQLAGFAEALAGGRAAIAIRTYFAPGDTVWHLDRVGEARAFRLLWPIGRRSGMRVTPPGNIDLALHRAYMRREHPLLGRLDAQVLRTGADPETLWAHRPQQLAAMRAGDFPFVRDRALEYEVTPGAASIHRVATPQQPGTYHRASWDNRRAPGLQIVITVTADRA